VDVLISDGVRDGSVRDEDGRNKPVPWEKTKVTAGLTLRITQLNREYLEFAVVCWIQMGGARFALE